MTCVHTHSLPWCFFDSVSSAQHLQLSIFSEASSSQYVERRIFSAVFSAQCLQLSLLNLAFLNAIPSLVPQLNPVPHPTLPATLEESHSPWRVLGRVQKEFNSRATIDDRDLTHHPLLPRPSHITSGHCQQVRLTHRDRAERRR